MPYEGAVPATPDELKARGLLPAGPLSPPMDPKTPALNEQAIKDQNVAQVTQQATNMVSRLMSIPGMSAPQFQNVKQGQPNTQLGFGQGGAPGAGQIIGQNLQREAPNIAGMAASTLVPGSGFLGSLGRIGAGGAAAGAVGGLQGKSPLSEGSSQAMGQAVGEGLGGAARIAGNTVLKNQFAKEQAEKVAGLIKKNVPALAKYGDDAKALHKMVYGDGMQAVSAEFDKSLKAGAAEARAKGIRIPLLAEDAEKLGLAGHINLDELESLRGTSAKNLRALIGSMPAGDVAEKIVGWSKKDPAMYRRVTSALDEAGVGDPAARKAYKYYTGFANYADKTKMLDSEKFWPDRAMSGALGQGKKGLSDTKQVNELRRRGMEDMMAVLRGPGESPMTSRPIGPWEKRLMGGAGGEILGHLGGQSYGLGGLAGAGAGELLIPNRIYHNTPLTPGVASGLQGGATFLGGLGRDYMQKMGSTGEN